MEGKSILSEVTKQLIIDHKKLQEKADAIEHAVYLTFDKNRIVRYVGISFNPERRFYQHTGHDGYDGYFLFRWYPSRGKAREVEKKLIERYKSQLLNEGNRDLQPGLTLGQFVKDADDFLGHDFDVTVGRFVKAAKKFLK